MTISLPDNSPIIVCFGGGVDSTAMLCQLKRAGIRPDLITFADTGGEKPETYAHVRRFDQILDSWGWPRVTWCRKVPTDRVSYNDLAGNCEDNETLPSLAFGMKSCSIKWKQVPQDYAVKGCKSGPNACAPHPLWIQSQARGVKPVKLIGYDASPADIRRSKKLKDHDADFHYRYPLQQENIRREECVKIITEDLGPDWVPLKSACWFCPASKQWELWWLAGAHPDLFLRALKLERGALEGKHSRFDVAEFGDTWDNLVRNAKRFPSSNTTVGLGRSFAWNQWAVVNRLVDQEGNFIADQAACLAKADQLRTGDNALDQRSC